MKILNSQNSANGYFGTFASVKGIETATGAWKRAFVAIHEHLAALPQSTKLDWDIRDIRNFLDSKYGTRCAEQALMGIPVKSQIFSRPSRFDRNFSKVVRDRDYFPSGE